MTQRRRRQRFARLLLAVMLPMLLLSALHFHGGASATEGYVCYDCANHVPHGGHLSAGALATHDCVVCQFMSLSFVPAVLTVLALSVPAGCSWPLRRTAAYHCRADGEHQLRAPPALSLLS